MKLWRTRDSPLCLDFRAMGKDLDKLTTEAIKAYIVLCRNGPLQDLVFNVES